MQIYDPFGKTIATNVLHFLMVVRVGWVNPNVWRPWKIIDQLTVYQQYIELAPGRDWPRWLPYGVWICAAGMFVSAIWVVFRLR